MSKTVGDHSQAECPACGKIIHNLWALGTDLYAGTKIECGHCGSEITIKSYVTLETNAENQALTRERQ